MLFLHLFMLTNGPFILVPRSLLRNPLGCAPRAVVLLKLNWLSVQEFEHNVSVPMKILSEFQTEAGTLLWCDKALLVRCDLSEYADHSCQNQPNLRLSLQQLSAHS